MKNIFKELFDDLGIQPPNSGCLERWSNQGVLLLNTYLTVERGKPGSHRNIGWERFTDYVLSKLSENKKNIVYLLWGKHAQEKAKIINSANNLVHEELIPKWRNLTVFEGENIEKGEIISECINI